MYVEFMFCSSMFGVVLQMFLTSAKPTIRFSAVKTLNRIAMIHPDAVTSCNVDLENLISDSNRSIATLAITTLLKVSLHRPLSGWGQCNLIQKALF